MSDTEWKHGDVGYLVPTSLDLIHDYVNDPEDWMVVIVECQSIMGWSSLRAIRLSSLASSISRDRPHAPFIDPLTIDRCRRTWAEAVQVAIDTAKAKTKEDDRKIREKLEELQHAMRERTNP